MGTIEVATFNCFGVAMDLKAVLRRRGPPDAHRLAHPEVRQSLAGADLVCMQEVWIPEAVELFDELDHPHKVQDANGWRLWPFTIAGSGLGIASRFPVVSQVCAPYRCGGAHSDQLARKGWIHTRLHLGEDETNELDLFTTHLQASTGAAARRVRACQLRELRSAVDELGAEDRPALIGGDLNIDGMRAARDGEYSSLVEIFNDFTDLGAGADEPTLCPRADLNELAHRYWSAEPNQRIDYLLYRGPQPSWIDVESVSRILDQRLTAHGGPATYASDHFGLAVRFRIGENAVSDRPS